MRTALLLGTTGLVGSALRDRLVTDTAYERIVTFVRRPLGAAPTKVEEVLVDYDRPETYRSHLSVDDVFCCLGTTIKKAGSRVAFRRVDLEIPLMIAKESLAAGAKRYLIVTAVGSDAGSSMFYSRVKGELEDELRALPFREGVKIFHPSLLLGRRAETRAGEKVGTVFMSAIKPLLVGPWERYRAITGDEVAAAMANAARSRDKNVCIYEGATLFATARAPAS